MKILKLYLYKVIASISAFAAVADVGVYSSWFFYQPEIPKQLKK